MKMPYNRIVNRGQFILGPSFIEHDESWKKIDIGSSLKLTAHPDLNTYQVLDRDKSITLIGYILDPDHPAANDEDILRDMCINLSNKKKCFHLSNNYGGRWVLIISSGEDIILFHDAVGSRQVFYSDVRYSGGLWCASQPGLIASILNFHGDKESVRFIESFAQKNSEHWWPGHSSPYKEIKHLSPNHYLDLKTGLCSRYWPDEAVNKFSPDDAAEIISGVLSGLMKSATERFDLALGLSSGWDSRVVLASSKEVKQKMSYYNSRKAGMDLSHPDIQIPRRLASKLNFKVDSIESHAIQPDSAFIEIFNNNIPFAHKVRVLRMQANLQHYNLSKVAVLGNVCEIGKCLFRLPGQEITAAGLATLMHMGDYPFAMKQFEEWLNGIKKNYGFNVLDLLHWEQRLGRWFAMNCLEYDIAWQDTFLPCNNRKVLVAFLSVDERYRVLPERVLYKKIINNLWPDVLSEPINPHKKKSQRFKSLKKLKGRIVNSISHALNRNESQSLP